eukprot:6465157-Amphidinium_carterae.1
MLVKETHGAQKRCNNRGCDLYHKVPGKEVNIIVEGNGRPLDVTTLSLILFNTAIGGKKCDTHLQIVCNHKATERVYVSLREVVASKVREIQCDMHRSMKLNDSTSWEEVHADEMTLRHPRVDGVDSVMSPETYQDEGRGPPLAKVLCRLLLQETPTKHVSNSHSSETHIMNATKTGMGFLALTLQP